MNGGKKVNTTLIRLESVTNQDCGSGNMDQWLTATSVVEDLIKNISPNCCLLRVFFSAGYGLECYQHAGPMGVKMNMTEYG